MSRTVPAYGHRGLAWKGASEATEALKTFFVSKGSADRDISVDRETLALRARNLYQNSAFAGALINTLDINVVGTGLKLRPVIPWELLGLKRDAARVWEKKTQTLFEIWASSKKCDTEKKADFHELQSLALKTQLVTGDVFALTQYNRKANPFGLCIKLLEADRCQNPFGEMDSQRLAQGIEVTRMVPPLRTTLRRFRRTTLTTFTDRWKQFAFRLSIRSAIRTLSIALLRTVPTNVAEFPCLLRSLAR